MIQNSRSDSDAETTALHCLGMCQDWAWHPAYEGPEHEGLRRFLMECAEGLRWQRDEIERLRAEVASLRLTMGMCPPAPQVAEPIGCPAPGACSTVREIERLRAIVRVNALRHGATHAEVDAVLYGEAGK